MVKYPLMVFEESVSEAGVSNDSRERNLCDERQERRCQQHIEMIAEENTKTMRRSGVEPHERCSVELRYENM